jgi:steroid 5-alpha reductase family enzyme
LWGLRQSNPIAALLVADVVATVIVFGFAYAAKNSSLYDPYWSVAPPLFVVYWSALGNEANMLRATFVAVLVFLWGIRLTANFFYGWRGLDHEDWRYRNLREANGRAYWLVSLTGIMLLPTLLVFLGSLPLMPALYSKSAPLNGLDALALVLGILALFLETVADIQLHRYAGSHPKGGTTLQTGLWAWSRHPNYLGEILFWWSLSVFGFASGGGWWVWIGATCITALFLFISIPMIEKRHLVRRPDYRHYQQRVPMLIPLPWVRRSA